MKKKVIFVIASLAAVFAFTACEAYLDKSPDLGTSEEDIFESYETIRGYLDGCYGKLEKWHSIAALVNAHHLAFTDELGCSVTQGNYVVNTICTGNWYSATKSTTWEIGEGSGTAINDAYAAIRIANRVINNMDQIRDITDDEKKLIIGQASFYRAWFYFQLIKRYGGMPILDQVYWGGEEDDIPRKTFRESFEWMAADIETAVNNLPDTWDDRNYGRPDKAAAMGFRAHAWLYAASPLFQNGLDATTEQEYDKDLCLQAAKYAQDCIDLVETGTTGRKFTQCADPQNNIDEYTSIFVFEPNTKNQHEEYLWWNRSSANQIVTMRTWWNWPEWDSKSAAAAQSFGMPTANIVEYFERKGEDGLYYPITDPRSGYVGEQNGQPGPWSDMQNRDPRMYNNILLPGDKWALSNNPDYVVTSWKGGSGYNKFYTGNLSKVREFTGYLCRKYIWEGADNLLNNNQGFEQKRFLSFYIRVTEMYLDYAEALFEATGSATSAPSGFKMTAKEAIDKVRARVGVTPVVDDYATPETFRETYRRERTVELMFENHRWEDIRRWMLFDELFPNGKGIYNTVWTCEQGENPSAADIAGGLTFTYTTEPNDIEVRNYTTRHYLYPFSGATVSSQRNLKQNPGW